MTEEETCTTRGIWIRLIILFVLICAIIFLFIVFVKAEAVGGGGGPIEEQVLIDQTYQRMEEDLYHQSVYIGKLEQEIIECKKEAQQKITWWIIIFIGVGSAVYFGYKRNKKPSYEQEIRDKLNTPSGLSIEQRLRKLEKKVFKDKMNGGQR